MKFIVNSSELLKELQKLSGVLSSGNTLPILDNFLFEFEEGIMKIVASDLETTMSTNLNVDTTDNGKINYTSKTTFRHFKNIFKSASNIFNQR